MPKLEFKVPSYCRHKASAQVVVPLSGRDHNLGQFGPPCFLPPPESVRSADSHVTD